MGLFYRRPLALFCFLFLISSFAAYYAPNSYFSVLFITFGMICVCLFVLMTVLRKFKIKLLTAFLCASVILIALIHSFAAVSVPKREAGEHVGERRLVCYVIDREYVSSYSEQYYVKIKNIEGKDTDIRATLICDFNADINPGDRIYGIAEVTENTDTYSESLGRLLKVYIEDDTPLYVERVDESRSVWETLSSEAGLTVLSARFVDKLKSVLYGAIGEEKGALAIGFFTGDRGDISGAITRDFRRAGVSHLMAVSGSHISILLGSIELLLRKLYVTKRVRCVIITFASIAFLFITGFSVSACRSVFMLYSVYLNYLLYEENDSLTSLFVSVVLIVLISPFSIMDLGLWMSFLATLGLLTAYPIFEGKIPYPRKKKGIVKRLLLIGRASLLVAVMTVIANMYLLPITWYFFGELSVVSVICNILLSPIATIFLISIPLLILAVKIPFISTLAAAFVSVVAEGIILIVRAFSRVPDATVSLRYGFCAVIVILFAISMAVLLTVRLRRKILITVPSVCAAVAFIVCLAVTNVFFSDPYLVYVNDEDNNEVIAVNEGDSISFLDNSSGGVASYYNMIEELERSTATEIGSLVITHYHKGHASAADMLMQSEIVRCVCLPVPNGPTEAEYAEQIWSIASSHGAEVVFYSYGDTLSLTDTVSVNAWRSGEDECFIAFSGEDGSVVCATPSAMEGDVVYGDVIISGHHVDDGVEYNIEKIDAENIFVCTRKLAEKIRASASAKVYAPREDVKTNRISLPIGQN